MFIDYTRIKIQSGRGGDGVVSFRREKFAAKGGPDGGDGGKGGSVIAVGNENINTLMAYRFNKQFKAGNGNPGGGSQSSGAYGAHVYLQVPLGTIVFDITNGKHEKMVEITKHKEEFILAIGGNGGRGNARFKTATNKTPRYAKSGGDNTALELELELKLMADVGLVGFPNAGKSTLLASISSARPKVADYQFTTLVPSLGVVHVSEYESFVMADIPGIIEGAHDGKGLGIQFLRHIQRTRTLLFLLDINSEDPYGDYQTLKNELHLYDPYLDQKPHLIVMSKIDTVTEEVLLEKEAFLEKEFSKKLKEKPIFISSVVGSNIMQLKRQLVSLIKTFDIEE